MIRRTVILGFFLTLQFPAWCSGSVQPEPDSLAPGTYYTLVKPDRSGDDQSQKINTRLDEPVRVKLVDEHSRPVAGYPVHFKIIHQPAKAKDFRMGADTAITDTSGIAVTTVTLGSKPGEYQLAARIEGPIGHDMQVFTFHARKSNWFFMLVIGLLGGLGLFLLGMDMMSEGMKKAAGDRLRTILGSLTRNRIIALGLGTFVTMIIQSSSATSVMLVGFVNSKLMRFRRTIAIILGANIGTTVTAQLIAFKLTDYSLLMIAVGFSLLYFSSRPKYKNIGQAILGFGILFFGMYIMSDAMYPLRSYTPFINLLLELENPLLGILVGAVFTAILQSSSAFIGIMIVLATQGLLTLEAAIPLLLGSNIGTSITAILASIKATTEAKKVALANAFVNISGMLLLVFWIPTFADMITGISPKSDLPAGTIQAMAETIPRQVANAHTVFNIMLACIFIPLTGLTANLINRILPEKEEPEEVMMKALYLDEKMIQTPALGLNLAKQETLRIGQITQEMVDDMILPFLLKDPQLIKDIDSKEQQVDFLSDEVNRYLMKIIRQEVEAERTNEAFQIMYTIKEFEQIADVCLNLVQQKAEEWIKSKVDFSEEGKRELVAYHAKTQKQLSRAIEVFRDVNLEKAKLMKVKHKKYRGIGIELEKSHYQRLLDIGKKIEASGDTHMDLITQLRIITSHATNIARILIEWETKKK